MYQINWECQAPPSIEPGHYTFTQRVSIVTFGTTREEHEQQANKKVAAIHGFDLMAVGLHNRRVDWEAVFGPSSIPDHCFADTKF